MVDCLYMLFVSHLLTLFLSIIAPGKCAINNAYVHLLIRFFQNEYIEEHIKRHGRRLDYYERKLVLVLYPVGTKTYFNFVGAKKRPGPFIDLQQRLKKPSV